MRSLENKIDDLQLWLSYQRDIKNWNILCFNETWRNKDADNIELARFSMHRQNRDTTSGKMGGGVCLFVNNSWCAMSNIKKVSRYYLPEVEYLMISCRPHYLPREFSSILFVAVYFKSHTDAGTKTALNNKLFKTISKQENAHPEISFTTFLLACHSATRGKKNSRPPLLHTQRCVQSSSPPSIWQIWT